MKVVHRIGKVENRLHLNMILENIMTAVCQSVVAVWEWVDWQISLTSVTLSLEVRLVHRIYIKRNFLEIELADAMLGGCSNLYTSNLN